ncbi:hypothetical protein [Halorubellus litoreus]|uniref:Yip1 domain-containing protein n=1 Tax=Halorubellus litoreus TaxID=755308 RepID=A0ABD5V8S0_9EURY
MSESTNLESEKEETTPIRARVPDSLSRLLNLDLLDEILRDLGEIHWFRVSITTFYVGVMGLSIWGAVFSIAFGFSYLFDSSGILSSISRFATVGPLIPVVLWMFAGFSKYVATNLSESFEGEIANWSTVDNIKMSLVASFSLGAAFILRYFVFRAGYEVYQDGITQYELGGLIIVDFSWVSLLLIGIGAYGAILSEQSY